MDEKHRIVIEARETASKEIARLNREINKLGGPAMVKSQRQIGKMTRELRLLGGDAKKAQPIWSRFTQGITVGILAAAAATKALGLLKDGVDEVVDATLKAARVGVLRVTLTQMGKTARISQARLLGLTQQIRALGITEQHSISILQRFIQAQLDVADAAKVARLAQDAAVVAGVNSSQAALDITDAINKQRPVLLKQYGIMVNLNTLYSDAADSMNKTVDSLTAQEKKQALLNDVLRQGKLLAGNYTAAMGEVGKQMTSLPRYFEDAQVAVGQWFLPALQLGVDTAKEFLAGIRELAESNIDAAASFLAQKKKVDDSTASITLQIERFEELQGKQSLTNQEQFEFNGLLDRLIAKFPAAVTQWNEYGGAIDISTEAIRTQMRVQQEMMGAQLIVHLREVSEEFLDLREQIAGVQERMSDPVGPTFFDILLGVFTAGTDLFNDNKEVWTGGMTELQDSMSELVTSIASQVMAMEDQDAIMAQVAARYPELAEALRAYIVDVAAQEELADAVTTAENLAKTIVEIPTPVFLSEEDELAEIEALENIGRKTGQIATRGMATTRMMKAGWQAAAASMHGAMGNATNSIIGSLGFLNSESRGIFKNIAQDFMKYFIRAIIKMAANVLVPGLLNILGSIFDTHANDMMAAGQGMDFGKYFLGGLFGVLRGADLGMAMGGQLAVGGGGTTVNSTTNLTFSGPVSNQDYIVQEIVPLVEQASRDGLSSIVVDDTELTGVRHVY